MGFALALGLLLLSPAPPAQGSLGVDAYWGNNFGSINPTSTGGRFGNAGPNGVAVYEQTGDVYVADSAYNRIQVFGQGGNFIGAWGQDVDLGGGTGFEICTVAASCKPGITSVATGGAMSQPTGISVNQDTGHVYVGDANFNRIQEFTAAGAFVRAFGQDVVSAGPGNTGTGFEICVAVNGDTCKGGSASGNAGGTLAPGSVPAVVPAGAPNAGNVLVAESARSRVQEFSSTGAFVRAFGWDVVAPGGSGASNINEIQKVSLSPELAGGTFMLSLGEGGPKTAALPSTADASAVEAALAALANVNGAANVEVSGLAGGPWTVEFTGELGDRSLSREEKRIFVTAATVAVGTQLSCSSSISSENTSFQWLRNGMPITGATGPTYTTSASSTTTPAITTGDAGAAIQCQITKSNNANGVGSTQVSNPAAVVATPSGTLPTAPGGTFAINGTVAAGNNLTCLATNGGGFGGSPTQFTYTWLKNGSTVLETETKVATSDTYELKSPDVASQAVFQCLVTGTNANGGVSRATNNKPTVSPIAPSPAAPGGNSGSFSLAVSLPSGTVEVIQPGSAAFEVCVVVSQCQRGLNGSGVGQFAGSAVKGVAEDPSGNIYTVESEGSAPRVQKFTLSGGAITPHGAFDCADLCASVQGQAPLHLATDGQGLLYVVKRFPIGQGNPPVVTPPGPPVPGTGPGSQERVLKIDPDANGGNGGLVDTMLINTGGEPGIEGDNSLANYIENVSSFASTNSGSRLYLATAFTGSIGGGSRIYRLGGISGPSGSVSTAAVGATAVDLEATIQPAATLGPVKTLYHFEYRREGTTEWVQTPSASINIGNGSAGGDSDSCSEQQQAATCHVSGEIDGLALGRTYEYRLVARTSYRGSIFTTAPQEFTTAATPPAVTTGGAVWSGPPSTGPSLTFNGSVNAQGASTTYLFEYVSEGAFQADLASGGDGFAAAQTAPAAPVSAGRGAKTVDVVVAKNGIDPASGYRFRLVAGNDAGTSTGNTSSVAPPISGERFVELVSAGDSQGADVFPQAAVSDDGERVAFRSLTFGSDQQAAHWINSPAIAQRGSDGWTTKAMGGDSGSVVGDPTQGGVGNAGVTQRLWGIRPAPQTAQWAVRNLDGSLVPITPVLSPLDRTGDFKLEVEGGSENFSTLVLKGGGSTLFPGEPLLSGTGVSNLYKVSGAGTESPDVSLLNAAAGGGTIGGACGASLGSQGGGPKTNAVSADGSVVYFSARAGTPLGGSCTTAFKTRIFKRVGAAPAIEVDQSQCSRVNPEPACSAADGDDLYWGASTDGSKAFFSSTRQLTSSDLDSTEDLYFYDASPPSGQPGLVQISAGEGFPGHTVGSGAETVGVVDFAQDGSRVYFVAKGRLTPQGSAGANNLYVYQRDDARPGGRIQFVATLAPGSFTGLPTQDDPRLWASNGNGNGGGKPAYAVGDGGHLLVFVSSRQLALADQDSFNDLYRYDDNAEQLACLSCVVSASPPVSLPVAIGGRNVESAKPDELQAHRVVSEDGSQVVFTTKEHLLTDDTNTAEDVYLWDSGELSLVSGATGATGLSYLGFGESFISPDGESVFFATRATLLPQDLDNGAVDFYAARVDGGFRQEDTAVACAGEDACRTALPSPPAPATSPGSAGFTGSGNVKTKKCAKKKVMRKGRCVKPKAKKQHKQKAGKGKKKSRTGSGRRAGR